MDAVQPNHRPLRPMIDPQQQQQGGWYSGQFQYQTGPHPPAPPPPQWVPPPDQSMHYGHHPHAFNPTDMYPPQGQHYPPLQRPMPPQVTHMYAQPDQAEMPGQIARAVGDSVRRDLLGSADNLITKDSFPLVDKPIKFASKIKGNCSVNILGSLAIWSVTVLESAINCQSSCHQSLKMEVAPIIYMKPSYSDCSDQQATVNAMTAKKLQQFMCLQFICCPHVSVTCFKIFLPRQWLLMDEALMVHVETQRIVTSFFQSQPSTVFRHNMQLDSA
eukprot:Gb_39409 [translate_table: standard]